MALEPAGGHRPPPDELADPGAAVTTQPNATHGVTVLAQVWNVFGTVVAPATLLTALLFYFGYVSARAHHAYFGVDVDTLGYSTQEFAMRAPQPLLVPGLVLLLGAAGLTAVNGAVRHRLRSASPASIQRTLRTSRWIGGGLLAAGLLLLVAYPAAGSWDLYPLVTPALLGAGAGTIALAATWQAESGSRGRATTVLLVFMVIACVFWATATIAQWAGTGQAKSLARELTTLPAVVLDTPEPLIPRDGAIVETMLPFQEGQTYRYRYRGLRLLAEGDGRLFLVPETWSSAGSTFVVDLDEARVRFRFVNDPP